MWRQVTMFSRLYISIQRITEFLLLRCLSCFLDSVYLLLLSSYYSYVSIIPQFITLLRLPPERKSDGKSLALNDKLDIYGKFFGLLTPFEYLAFFNGVDLSTTSKLMLSIQTVP